MVVLPLIYILLAFLPLRDACLDEQLGLANDMLILALQLFFGSLIRYAVSQAYGFAALFGLVEDLGLYTARVVDGKVVLNTTKYSLSAGMVSLS